MDRRSHQNYPRGNPRPFDHGAEADRAYKQIHCRNGQINGLEEYHGAFQEERTTFCHSMRKQKDKIKRLEELLKYRDSGLHKENTKLVDTIMEHEAEISRLNGNIENAECQHKRQMDQIVARHEAEKGNVSDEKAQATSDSVNNDVPLQCDPEIIKLRMRKGETMKELMRKGEELLECVTILEDRNSDLEEQMREQEEKFSKDLADKSHTWETEKQQMVTTLNELTQEKNNMTKETLTLESEFKQVEAKLKQVEKEKDRLAENNLSCETDIKQLKEQVREQEEKFSKDLADKSHTWETEKQQMVTTLDEVTQEKNNMTKETLTLESEFKQVEAKLKQVEKEKDRLAENNLSWETDVKQLKEQLREQEEKFSKDLAEKQLNWEQFVQGKETDFKQLENQLEDQKKKFSKDLALNQESWESKVNLVETKLNEVTQKKDDLVKKHQSMETKLHLTETQLEQVEEQRDDLAQRRLSWATTEKKMEEENKLLEDLCLHMKNKSRGFFSRRRGETEDRDVALQKMISKMQEKEMRKKAKDARNTSSEKMEEMEEASGDSAPAGQQ
ncbi:golgin subfamily A member 6-like protein 22 [Pseudochaenichthys georgianus]|uniref:golgin subfamily A member 6-like protein 22 n=1 Tax=Pseudochaenichthys georgianus TaxID=52239 RepID=UPI00146B1994|nr:golgin subfamily A member 6-like protein 22 [Pseudochaenichthys georgianus]